jgi:hypothetical protein
MDEDTVWLASELELAIVTGLENLLSSTVLITVQYCVQSVMNLDMDIVYNRQERG